MQGTLTEAPQTAVLACPSRVPVFSAFRLSQRKMACHVLRLPWICFRHKACQRPEARQCMCRFARELSCLPSRSVPESGTIRCVFRSKEGGWVAYQRLVGGSPLLIKFKMSSSERVEPARVLPPSSGNLPTDLDAALSKINRFDQLPQTSRLLCCRASLAACPIPAQA